MSSTFPKSLGQDLERLRHGEIDKAIERAIVELKHAAEAGRTDADAMMSAATEALAKAAHSLGDETRRRSGELTRFATKEVRGHPVVSTTIAAAAIAAIAGLALALLQPPRKSRG